MRWYPCPPCVTLWIDSLYEYSNNQTRSLPAYTRDLTRCDCAGTRPEKPTYVAIKRIVFDVSGNQSYAPGGSYHGGRPRLIPASRVIRYLILSPVFAGKDGSRALARSSLKLEDCSPEYDDLGEKEKKVLNDWYSFFSKRYNIVGKVEG